MTAGRPYYHAQPRIAVIRAPTGQEAQLKHLADSNCHLLRGETKQYLCRMLENSSSAGHKPLQELFQGFYNLHGQQEAIR